MNGPVRLVDIQHPNKVICCYGKYGCGKTVFSGGSQKLRTFVFDIDDGVDSLKGFQGRPDFPVIRQDLIMVWQKIKTRDEFFRAYAWFLNNIKYFDLVVMDTVTELASLLLDQQLIISGKDIATIVDWGVTLTSLERLARQMRALPCHVIWNAHETKLLNPETGRYYWAPNFKGQFKNEYGKHFDEIWRYVLIDQVVANPSDNSRQVLTHRYLQCQPDQHTETKDRSDRLAKYELPQLDKLLDKILMVG